MSTTPVTPMHFGVSFDPKQILQQAEDNMKQAFKNTTVSQINAFFSENPRHTSEGFKRYPGAGLLLIQEFLEKKFDDPATQDMMVRYFDTNFERIMEEAMQKAMAHKANSVVFAKTKARET